MQILIANCVDPNRGNYPGGHPGQWFMSAASGDVSRFHVWHALLDDIPPPAPWDGVFISGSPASAYDDRPWIARVARLALDEIEAGTPVLGVCFGHQLLAQALGGRVEKNPGGREVGTLPVELTELGAADPLFTGLPRAFPCFHGHSDAVTELPPGAECLASSVLTPVQSFRLGERVRGIQFHPEFTIDIVRYILARDAERLVEDGISAAEVEAGLAETPVARRVLDNFERYFIQDRATFAR